MRTTPVSLARSGFRADDPFSKHAALEFTSPADTTVVPSRPQSGRSHLGSLTSSQVRSALTAVSRRRPSTDTVRISKRGATQ